MTVGALPRHGPTNMLEQYFPILLFILVGLGLGVVLLTVGGLVSPRRPSPPIHVCAKWSTTPAPWSRCLSSAVS